MKIISHRGYWRDSAEKNTAAAFQRSFNLGFGTETDIRDMGGQLVISHDPPQPGVMDLADFLHIHRAAGGGLPLAFNIKADGLQAMLKKSLEDFGVNDYFVFDMSVPDMLCYHNAGVPFYTRMSEYERDPVFLNEASGVWLDGFNSEWFSDDDITSLLKNDKPVCVVSSELHRRDPQPLWKRLRMIDREVYGLLMLCTDVPEEACSFFAEPSDNYRRIGAP